MGRKKKILSKDLLEKEYWDNALTIRQIARKYNMAKDTINKLLSSYDIAVRSPALAPVKSRRAA